jgi:ribosome maturation factor RimP
MPTSRVDAAQLEALVAPVCKALGVELVDVRHQLEASGAVLRVLIELPDQATLPQGMGVTLDDCTRVSRAVSQLLDQDEDLVPGQYHLEVSSAGVERPLVKPIDYERYRGREAHITLRTPVDGRKNFSGTLDGLRGDQVLLLDSKGDALALPLDGIAKAHLVFRF